MTMHLVPKARGAAGFPALLIERRLISRADLSFSEEYGAREHVRLVDAVAALGLVNEAESYALFAEAIGRLRRDISMATLPIMVLTSEEGPGVERRVLDLGADDYIVKPFDPAVLLSRVNGVFRRLSVAA